MTPPNHGLVEYRLGELDRKLDTLLDKFEALAEGRAKLDVRLSKVEQRTKLIWTMGSAGVTLSVAAVLKAFSIFF